MKKKKIYFAAPLFSEAEILYNAHVVNLLREAIDGVDIYLPQENFEINDKSKTVTSSDIFHGDTDELLSSEYIIALIDGPDIDSGVAAELGIAWSHKKKIYALCTDIRLDGHDDELKLEQIKNDATENSIFYKNQYVVGLIKEKGIIIRSREDLIDEIVNELKK